MNREEFFSSLSRPADYIVSALDNDHLNDSQPDDRLQKQSLCTMIRALLNRFNRKKRSILLLTFWNYPHVGGLPNYLTSLKKGLEALGHEVDIISPNFFDETKRRKIKRKYKKEIGEFFLNRYGTKHQKIMQNIVGLYAYEQLLSEMNLDKYDVFHAQDIFTANIIGRINKWYKKPVFFTPHGHYTDSRIRFGKINPGSIEENYFRCIEKQALNNAVKTIIISDSFRKPLLQYGAHDHDLLTIHTGITMREVKKQRNNPNIVITTISRLSPRKGHTDLLEALSLIKPSLRNVEVRIVGDGEMREKLERLTKKLDLSMVQFLGSREDIPELLSESDIFILPTLNDNLPVSIIEAMIGEQAIITTPCGGIPEIIHHGQTGLLIPPGKPKEIASQLLLLIQEPGTRQLLATNAKEYAQANLTSETMVKKVLKVYNNYC